MTRERFHVSCGAVVVQHKQGVNRVLIMYRRRSHSWHLPKGTKVLGETNQETAQREVKEETGYTISIRSYLGMLPSWFERDGKVIHKKTYYYVADPVKKTSMNDGEHDIVRFVDFDRAIKFLDSKVLHERESKILAKARWILN